MLARPAAPLPRLLRQQLRLSSARLRAEPARRRHPAAPAMAANGVRPRIVLFGDSLTQRGQENGYGWASLLADAYTRKARSSFPLSREFSPLQHSWRWSTLTATSPPCAQADIVNRGYSGYNTVWALHALEEIFPQARGREHTHYFLVPSKLRLPSHAVRTPHRASPRRCWSPSSSARTTRRCPTAAARASTCQWLGIERTSPGLWRTWGATGLGRSRVWCGYAVRGALLLLHEARGAGQGACGDSRLELCG